MPPWIPVAIHRELLATAVVWYVRRISSESLANINLCQSSPPTIYNRSSGCIVILLLQCWLTRTYRHVESVTDVSWSFICSHRATVIPGNSWVTSVLSPLSLPLSLSLSWFFFRPTAIVSDDKLANKIEESDSLCDIDVS